MFKHCVTPLYQLLVLPQWLDDKNARIMLGYFIVILNFQASVQDIGWHKNVAHQLLGNHGIGLLAKMFADLRFKPCLVIQNKF